MSIPDIILQIKRGQRVKKMLILLVFLGSHTCLFLLGITLERSFMQKKSSAHVIYPPLMTVKTPVIDQKQSEPVPEREPVKIFEIVASKTGSVYYSKDCTAYTRIKEENRVYFTSESDALAQGLQKSSRCP